MDITVEHDDLGTHFDWQLDGVTPRMVDWFWSNPLGYRVHQWSAADGGVRGRSSGIGRRKPEDAAAGQVWAAHAAEEFANWEVFLPTLYRLWRVVPEGPRNPYADLGVKGTGRDARYRMISR